MQGRANWLSDAERQLVIDEALTILERTGMRMAGSRVLPFLEAVGASVDHQTGVVRFPRDLVMSALARCPSRVLMAGATPSQDVVLEGGRRLAFNYSGCMAKTLDYRTGEQRPSTLADLTEGTIVMDATDQLDVVWTFLSATDVPLPRRELLEYYTYLTETAKPVVFVDCPTEVEAVRAIFGVLGDDGGFRARPRVSVLCAARSPLEVNGDLLDLTCEFAALGAPVWGYTMPIAGATGPVTVAGMLAVMWAEVLGLLTAIQTAAPRSPFVACCGPGILDMRTTTMSLGALENTLIGVACVEIAHSLGLPAHNSALSTDAKHLGVQAGYEKGLKVIPAALAGCDIISGGFGAIDTSTSFQLLSVPIDAEIAAMVRRLIGQVEVSVDTLMRESIEAVGIGGNYLGERETRRRVRAGEHFMPAMAARIPYEQWRADGRTELDAARETVERALAERPARGAYLTAYQRRELALICGVADHEGA
jgi:trimethylamine---corrinoid protein Co-methyltransferase